MDANSFSISAAAESAVEDWHQRGLLRQPVTFQGPQTPRTLINNREFIQFASSDYLGLSTHPKVIAAAHAAAAELGVGAGGSRLTTGTSNHLALEQRLAEFFHAPAAVLFASGFQTNTSVLPWLAKLARSNGHVEMFSDALNHASLIDGIRASKVPYQVFAHMDYSGLGSMLEASTAETKIVVSDTVFSMTGEHADLQQLRAICAAHGAWLVLDDAHGTGTTYGGRGAAGCPSPDYTWELIVGTASKALGVEGGFVLTSTEAATALRNQCRGYVFSTAPSPMVAAAISAAIDVLHHEPQRVHALQENIRTLRTILGITDQDGQTVLTPIVPWVLGDTEKAVAASQRLKEQGILVPAIRYPTVAQGDEMLRFTVMATHTEQDFADLERALRG